MVLVLLSESCIVIEDVSHGRSIVEGTRLDVGLSVLFSERSHVAAELVHDLALRRCDLVPPQVSGPLEFHLVVIRHCASLERAAFCAPLDAERAAYCAPAVSSHAPVGLAPLLNVTATLSSRSLRDVPRSSV